MAYYNSKKILSVVANNANVNTGTFDPTSDNPAGQKQIMALEMNLFVQSAIARGTLSYLFTNSSLANYIDLIDSRFINTGSWELYNLDGKCDHMFSMQPYNVIEIKYNDTLQMLISRHNNNTGNDSNWAGSGMFRNSYFLTTIGAYDFSACTNLSEAFLSTSMLKHIHITHFPVSFDISYSTQFEEADLVEIIGNLVDLTGKTSQTLTMGATNLAKLTDAEKAVAVNKNWVLA